MDVAIRLSETKRGLECSVDPVGWDDADRFRRWLEENYGLDLREHFDGPDARLWRFELADVSVSLEYDDMVGASIYGEPTARDLITRISVELPVELERVGRKPQVRLRRSMKRLGRWIQAKSETAPVEVARETFRFGVRSGEVEWLQGELEAATSIKLKAEDLGDGWGSVISQPAGDSGLLSIVAIENVVPDRWTEVASPIEHPECRWLVTASWPQADAQEFRDVASALLAIEGTSRLANSATPQSA